MERQQNHYRTVLETANQSVEDESLVTDIPLWEIPKPKVQQQIEEGGIFDSVLGQQVGDTAAQINFFQFCRILESLLDQDTAGGLQGVVRFRRVKSLSFPAGEIAEVEHVPEYRLPSVRTTFLGLYGVDAVLPDYFFNDIATNTEGSESLAAFLDIFNHRISILFYQAWLKYRYPFQFTFGGSDDLSLSLLHLIGQTTKGDALGHNILSNPILDSKILGLLSVFHQRTRTSDGVKSIVKYISPNAAVNVTEFCQQWINLDGDRQLGNAPLRLDGGSAVLGRRIKDYNHLIDVDITPTRFEAVQELLPKEPLHQRLMELLKIYLGHRLDASIYLNIKKEWIPQAKLSSVHILGINTGLGRGKADKRIKVGNCRLG
ncbi:type VI secretion system baseplate subunit TssG [Neisseria canis]|uniref:Uncharacterized protein conserved in bacteria n=1 Tax=Neisseria canis TaxID=493 RepID=A0A1X3CRU0_9NEIS|nr:type VI secretion system baseplate subunit TssG [Neisseria canis]OSI10328.1 type VI secretion protein [Neisseria canis]VEF00497.1 Uncharacterized protein conserved in bacteria [Neisseria canis]